MPKFLLPPETLGNLLSYDECTGGLFWRERQLCLFNATFGRSQEHSCAQWNARHAGAEAFISKDTHGYKNGKIFGKTYLAHRVIIAITSGQWPDFDVDHINGDRSDNRIENLRCATRRQNSFNRKVRRESSSGVKGVSRAQTGKKWVARIQASGERLQIGRFGCITAAMIAYELASRDLHGIFGRRA